jgi:hypothetical protein
MKYCGPGIMVCLWQGLNFNMKSAAGHLNMAAVWVELIQDECSMEETIWININESIEP